ncbi:SabA family sialic acid-binding adhesin, partial [Helicobacter pylori]
QGGGMPALNDTTKTGVVNIQQTNYRTTAQNNIIEHYYTENGKEIPTSYSGGSAFSPTIQLKYNNNAEYLLQQAATIMQVLITQKPHVQTSNGGKAWGLSSTPGNVVDIFGPSFNAINEM